jgi:hypothetical protein
MSHFSRKPISSLILKLFFDHDTPFEPPFYAEKQHVSLFRKVLVSSKNDHVTEKEEYVTL